MVVSGGNSAVLVVQLDPMGFGVTSFQPELS